MKEYRITFLKEGIIYKACEGMTVFFCMGRLDFGLAHLALLNQFLHFIVEGENMIFLTAGRTGEILYREAICLNYSV